MRETGDHGTFNSWDRKEWFYACPEDPTKYCFTPKITHVQRNMFIGPAGWNMDVSTLADLLARVVARRTLSVSLTILLALPCSPSHRLFDRVCRLHSRQHDDGSSQFFDSFNIVYEGGYKYRDGVNRNMTGNLMVKAAPAFQCTGFDKDYYLNNIHVGGSQQICGPSNIGGLSGNVYLTVSSGDGAEGGVQEGSGSAAGANKCDPGTKRTVTIEQVHQIAKETIQLGPHV